MGPWDHRIGDCGGGGNYQLWEPCPSCLRPRTSESGHSAASDPQDERTVVLLPTPECSLEHHPI